MKLSHFDEARFDKSNFDKALGSDPKNPELPSIAKILVSSGKNPDAELELDSALMLEHRILSSMAINPPNLLTAQLLAITNPAVQIGTKRFARRKVWLAMAASVTACALIAGSWFLTHRNAADAKLAADCVEHLAHEPFALSRTTRVPPTLVNQLFNRSGMVVDADMVVNYLQPCVVDGQIALHIVVQRNSGPVTVLVFPDSKSMSDLEHSIAGAQVRTRGFDGGGLVFMAESSRDFDAVEAKLLASLRVQRIQSTG